MDWTEVCAAAARGASAARNSNYHLVDEAVQEVCLSLLMGKEIRNPRVYGRFYAQNLGRNRRRRPDSFTKMNVNVDLFADSESTLWSVVDEVCSPEEAVVIRDRYIGRMTVAEIVASTGWPQGRVVGLLKSAIRALRESLCEME